VIGTALLLLLIFAITDEFNMPPGSNLAPLMVGLVVAAIGMSFGAMHGYAINPARDLVHGCSPYWRAFATTASRTGIGCGGCLSLRRSSVEY